MKTPIYQVDAFANKLFRGNPAAVCPFESWPDDTTLQAVAAENNLSETAFFVKKDKLYELRWFKPEVEVDLCGHATLASAFVIFQILEPTIDSVEFSTKSGILRVARKEDLLCMDFPSRPPSACDASEKLLRGLKVKPKDVLKSRDYMAVYESEDQIRTLSPDMSLLAELDATGIIATSAGSDADFVSRFFAPAVGVPEDPVTGSAHSTLVPYWAKKLNKTRMHARQLSKRGGELFCEDAGDRVKISGHAVMYLEGMIRI